MRGCVNTIVPTDDGHSCSNEIDRHGHIVRVLCNQLERVNVVEVEDRVGNHPVVVVALVVVAVIVVATTEMVMKVTRVRREGDKRGGLSVI